MSRYLLLFLLNLPFALAAILSAVTQYKLGKISKRKALLRSGMWFGIIIALGAAQPLYSWLFSHNLTQTEPLSLFDVVLFSGLVISLYIINQTRIRTDDLEKRLRDLHQELSIILSQNKKS